MSLRVNVTGTERRSVIYTQHRRSHEHKEDDENKTQLPSRGSNGSQQNVPVPLWCVRVCVL